MAGRLKTWVKLLAQGVCALPMAALPAPASAQIPCRYEVTVLPSIDCGFWNGPPPVTGLNNLGHVVGWGGCSLSYERAVVWTGGPTWSELPMPPGVVGARAYDINDLGEIVGRMQVQVGPKSVRDHAFLYRNGQMIDLGFLPGGNWSTAYAINNRSQITGFWGNVITGNPALHAFIWEDGVMTDLNLPMGPENVGYDIDEDGRITGWMGAGDYFGSHPFIWHDGIISDLGDIPDGVGAEGRAIANDGQTVVGFGWLPDASKFGQHRSAFLWQNGEMQDIGTLPGFTESFGLGISGSAAFGYCGATDPPEQAAFIHFNGAMRRLDGLVDASWQLQLGSAVRSNDQGQIVADGFAGSTRAAVLLTPVWAAASDIDANCLTNMDDLLIVIGEWGQVDSPADINNNGLVNIQDLLIVIENWTVF